MRKFDYEQLNTALENLEKGPTPKATPIPESRQWVADILEHGDQHINALVDTCPQLERQKLRQYYRDYHAAEGESQTRIRTRMQDYINPFLRD